MNTTEIENLHQYLNTVLIDHEYKDLYDGKQIIIKNYDKKYSFITHSYSYGGDEDLIEYYDWEHNPKGNLTANQCKRLVINIKYKQLP